MQILRTSGFLLFWLLMLVSTIRSEDKAAPAGLSNVNSTRKQLPDTPRAEKEITNSIGMKLRLIPSGEFLMGSLESEKERSTGEQQHMVRITRAFYLGEHEVTQREWKAVMETKPWKGNEYVKEGDDYPATYVSWEDAVDFCKKLSRKEGKEYRLPTEAEWEYACRGGKTTRYHYGDDEIDLGDYAWYDKNTDKVKEEYAHRVGQKRANEFGLHDMHGNVWEWCSDWYNKKYLATSPTEYLQGPATGSKRVNRGGCWGSRSAFCRSAYREWDSPSRRYSSLGFRVAHSSVTSAKER